MKIKQLLEIQKIVEGRAIPYDVLEGIEETTYYSKSKEQHWRYAPNSFIKSIYE